MIFISNTKIIFKSFRTSIIFTVLFLFFSLNVSAGQFTVIRVYDGDTFKAVGHDIEIKVRLVGIDAPETSRGKRKPGQPYSQRAKKFLANMILNKIVDIKGYGLGPYNRILGAVYIYGHSIELELLKAGLAEVYKGKHPRGFDPGLYRKAEASAKKANRGMWSLGKDYISPKEWRKIKRKNK